MPVLFGEKRRDGLIIVGRTAHYNEKGVMATTRMKEHSKGYDFEEMPVTPAPEAGFDYTMLFNPKTRKFVWEKVKREMTETEQLYISIMDMESLVSKWSASSSSLVTEIKNEDILSLQSKLTYTKNTLTKNKNILEV